MTTTDQHWLVRAAIAQGVRPDPGNTEPRNSNAPVVNANDPEAAPWLAALMRGCCQTVAQTGEGSRNDTLYKQSFRVGTFVSGGYLDEGDARLQLMEAAGESGLGTSEAGRTIRQGFSDAWSCPATLQLEPHREAYSLEAPVKGVESHGDDGESDSRYVRGGAFIFDVPEMLETVWGDGGQILWASGEALIFVGPPGVGKTTICQQLTLARCGMASELFGLTVTPSKSKVLYLAMDRPSQAARSMKRMVKESDRDLLDQRLVVWPGPPPYDIAKNPTVLLELAEKAGADTIVVDSIKDAAVGLVDSETAGTYNRARQHCLSSGVEVLEIAHPRKGGGERKSNKSIDDLHGGMEIAAGAGSIVAIEGDPGDLVVNLAHRKQPMEVVGPMQLGHDHESGRTTIYSKVTVLDILTENSTGNLSAADVARRLHAVETPSDSDKERARHQLDKLVTAGLAAKTPGNRSTGDLYQAAQSPTTFEWRG